jgi:hypothetical protein
MTTFDERERAFEAAFAHDQDMRFRAFARRNKALGLWAAGRLGKTGEDAEAYAKSVVAAGVARAGDASVMEKIAGDLQAGGAPVPDEEIGTLLVTFMNDAILAQKAKV